MTAMRTMVMVAAVAMAATAAHGVTEQWRGLTASNIVHVVADGKGGCAVAYLYESEKLRVVWYDGKGDVLYDSGIGKPQDFSNVIAVCTPKQLVYTTVLTTNLVAVHVTPKGTQEVVVDFEEITIGGSRGGVAVCRMGDRKGFFAINVNTNTGSQTLVRYRYK